MNKSLIAVQGRIVSDFVQAYRAFLKSGVLTFPQMQALAKPTILKLVDAGLDHEFACGLLRDVAANEIREHALECTRLLAI